MCRDQSVGSCSFKLEVASKRREIEPWRTVHEPDSRPDPSSNWTSEAWASNKFRTLVKKATLALLVLSRSRSTAWSSSVVETSAWNSGVFTARAADWESSKPPLVSAAPGLKEKVDKAV